MDTIRIIIALAAQKGWDIFQLDVKSAFLYGKLTEDVFVEQPKGYVKKGSEDKVYKLNKALYGLKQAPRAWFSRIESYFLQQGFKGSQNEQTLFLKSGNKDEILIVSIYVDDLIFTGNCERLMKEFKEAMSKEFSMTDLGKMKYFLGIEVVQSSEGIGICQRKYAAEILSRFNMTSCNAVKVPMMHGTKLDKDVSGEKVDNTAYKQLVGSLMYMTTTRPDIMFPVSLVSRYMSNPTQMHWQACKRILRYLQGTLNLGIMYKKGGNTDLIGFTDSDYAGDIEDRKSTSGYVFVLSNGAVAWSSKKQPIVTLSSTEAEFIAAGAAATQAVWMIKILKELGQYQKDSSIIMCDNTSTIKLTKNPILHGRSKHIEVRYHYIRELVRAGTIELKHCGTKDQLADVLTKAVSKDSFLKLRSQLGICEIHQDHEA